MTGNLKTEVVSDEKVSLKNLAKKVIEQNQQSIARVKSGLTVPLFQSGTLEPDWTFGTNGTLGTTPSENDRQIVMRVMADWNERASMMTCSSCPTSEAELAAWTDLRLDEVFFGKQQRH